MLHYGVSEGLPAELMNVDEVLIIVSITVLESLLVISCYNGRHLVTCNSSSQDALQCPSLGGPSAFSCLSWTQLSERCKCCIPSLMHFHLVVFALSGFASQDAWRWQ